MTGFLARIVAFLLVFLSVAVHAEIVQRSYSWYESGPGTTKIMVPPEWHTGSGEVKGNFRAYVSVGEPDSEGDVEAGLTMDVLKHLQELTLQPPSNYAQTFISVVMNGKKIVEPAWKRDLGDVVEFGMKLRNEEKIFQYKLVANNKTGTLYILVFQSPEDQWDEAWQHGELMLQDIKLDMEI